MSPSGRAHGQVCSAASVQPRLPGRVSPVTAVGPAAGQCAGEQTLCAVRVSGRRQPIAGPCRAAFTLSASRRPATGTEGKRTCCSARQGTYPGPCDDTGNARDGGAVVARRAVIAARDAPPVLEAAKHRRTNRLRRRSPARLCLQGTVRVAVDGRVVNPAVSQAIRHMQDAADHPPVVDPRFAWLVVRQVRPDPRPGLVREPERPRHREPAARQTTSSGRRREPRQRGKEVYAFPTGVQALIGSHVRHR
jgi:hypothetical protein